ncbi:uncharacterized protein LY79DRAFT_515564 [Colletotrichum navitas]|uniref:Uncharacterized protein n=1 Tax=Colletotrichum navitas TaxID=681940 RepID=A0AAD8PYV2_9PEZI|nr:uncharacterized protein LY79DRAFT_515564 [Colletotrichum navitas]KAK1590623.1 hypothetical protein LY79DRAFT_515564 [Colletotrichum navitas]
MPLKKSYSEHVGLPSKNRSWQRSKSNPVNAQISRPLAPVSEKTKSKLNQFQFQSAKASDQENGSGNEDGIRQTRDDIAITPTTKLSWHDLMESNAPKQDDTQISPSERVLWNNERDKNNRSYAAALSPMMPRKGRKRARSSSPISSPTPHEQPVTPAVNVKKLSEAFKSPRADPTLELWDRFSLTSNGNVTPLGITNPTLANLMFSSSPRNPKNANPSAGDSGLRRAISCGLNWPKRRRVDRSDTPSLTSTLTRETTDSSKNSLVTALLDTVTGSMHENSPPQESEPSVDREDESPSLKKRKTATMRPPTLSPSRKPLGVMKLPHSGNTLEPSVAQDLGLGSKGNMAPVESDYGDVDFDEFDEFDDDTFLEIEASISLSNPKQDARQSTPTPAPPAQPVQAVQQDDVNLDDEFGDLDDDIFEAAETIMESAEVNAASQAPTSTRHAAAGTVSVPQQDDLEDVFGDDFGGDFDFDAAELAATQSAQIPHESSTTAVRPNQRLPR